MCHLSVSHSDFSQEVMSLHCWTQRGLLTTEAMMEFYWLVWTGPDTESWVSSGVERFSKTWSSRDTSSLIIFLLKCQQQDTWMVTWSSSFRGRWHWSLNFKKWAWQLFVGVWVRHCEALWTVWRCRKVCLFCCFPLIYSETEWITDLRLIVWWTSAHTNIRQAVKW